MGKALILALPLLLLVTGCAHQISEKSLALADRSITFSKLRENPDAYRGKFIVLGGTIAIVKDIQEGTQLEVVQYDLDSREMPDETSVSGGRFLAITPDFLDISTCRPGAAVSLGGEVAGGKAQPLQGAEYTYPVIVIKELHFVKVPEEQFFRTWNPYGP
jgi:outer membrane lipoprotein